MRNLFKNLFKKSADVYSLVKSNDILSVKNTLSPRKALDYNQISLYINRGFSKRAEKVGEIEFILKKRGIDNVVEKNPILDLLDKPNSTQTGDTFWRLATLYRDVTGMAVIRKKTNGEIFRDRVEITELELLNSACIEVIESRSENKILYFKYTNPNTYQIENIPYEECIYWYIPDPINPLQPVSLILAGLLSADSSLENEKQYNSILRNGGSVDGVFRFKESITKERVDQLKLDYAKLMRDNKESKVPLILGGDASFERIALSPQELQTLESKKMILEDLLVLTGVPKSLLGIASEDTYANAETAYRIFLRETIKPIMKDLVNVLDWKLVPEEYDLDFVDPTPEDTEQKLAVLKVGSEVNALTLNEQREMLGKEPIEGGDEIKEKPTFGLLANSLKEFEKKKITFEHPLRNEKFRDVYFDSFMKSVASDKKKFKNALLAYFNGQKDRLLSNLPTGKSISKDYVSDIFNIDLEISYMTPILKVLEQIAREQGQKTLDLFGGGEKFNYNSAVQASVNRRFRFLAEQINLTTIENLKGTFDEWALGSETIGQLTERINDAYDFGKENKWRADTITNTEVSSITNSTKGDAYRQIGITTKIWVHRAGIKGGVREDHQSLDGEERDFDKPFSNGMQRPHDENADASQVINCNCTW